MNKGVIKVDKVWLTDTAICIRTSDGREASEKFADFQRLKHLPANLFTALPTILRPPILLLIIRTPFLIF